MTASRFTGNDRWSGFFDFLLRGQNPNFNYGEFAAIKSQAGLNSYKISVKEWVENTNALMLER